MAKQRRASTGQIEDVYRVAPILADDTSMDRLIDWRLSDPRYKSASQLRRDKMQRQFTIELRVDYSDPDKNQTMKDALAAAARHVFATAALLSDGVPPQISIFSDDYFSGHEDIALLEDTIKKGKDEITGSTGSTEEPVSSELMQALTTKT